MPSFVTHNIFAKEVKDKIEGRPKKIVDNYPGIYLMASQSFDLFKYNLINHKKLTKLCGKCHRINVNSYFINLIEETKKSNNEELISFIYGSITHNILDAYLHPYIFYKTGIYNGSPETKKYDGLHTLLETQFDMFTYERYYQKSIIKKNVASLFFPKFKVDKNTVININKVYNKMYNINGGTYLLKGYNTARRLANNIRCDRFYNRPIINTIHLIKNNYLHYYMYNKNNISYQYLNINHQTWNYPTDLKIKKKDSLIDLYNESINTCTKAINILDKYFHNEAPLEDFLNIIGNKAYVRGIDCNTIDPIIYFEF